MLARGRDRLAEHLVRDARARLRHLRPPDEAPPEVVVRQRLARAVLAHEPVDDLRAERAAVHERSGEHAELVREPCEVHDADGVHGPERGRADEVGGEPGVEVVGVVLAEEVHVALDEMVDLVLVPEADACRDFVKGWVVWTGSGRATLRLWHAYSGVDITQYTPYCLGRHSYHEDSQEVPEIFWGVCEGHCWARGIPMAFPVYRVLGGLR